MKTYCVIGAKVRNTAVSVIEYLILKVLADKEEVVKALYDYFVEGLSPSSIAFRYGLSKHQVRGYVQRIMEKTGSALRAKALMKYAVPLIIKIKPVAKKLNESMVACNVCGEELPLQIIEDHIKKKHPEIVSECLYAVIDILKKNMTIKSNR